jgi:putative ABC transport system substrate-binding protein
VKSRITIALLLLCALLPTAARIEERPRVVALRAMKAQPYEVSLEALRRRIGGSVDLMVEDVERGSDTDADRIAALNPDAIVAIGTQATAWARDSIPDVPIVFAMVLNPVSGGLVESMQEPGGRITGAALDIPPQQQLETLHKLLGARRIAVLYNPAVTGLLVEEAREAAERAGLELVAIEVTDPRHLEAALSQLDDSIDALWSVADRTVLSRGVLEQVLLHTIRESVPFMGLSAQYVRAGALLALDTSYEENGRLAGELLERVLAGEAPGALPIAVPREIDVVFNPRTAERLDIELVNPTSLALRPLQ